MTTVRKETEVNGNTYRIKVSENSYMREVRVRPSDNSFSIVRDGRYKNTDRSFIDKLLGRNKPEPYPDRTKHVADALNKAISKYENRLSLENEMREEMQCAIDAAEVWDDS